MNTGNLRTLYIRQLRDLYSAENQLMRTLPRLVEAASSPVLRATLAAHLEQTCTHVDRLDYLFVEAQHTPRGRVCRGMEGLLCEANELLEGRNEMGDELDDPVLDAALIAAAQRVEHYEMAAYGTACTFAEELGLLDAAHLLHQTLDEESATERQLKTLATGKSYPRKEENGAVLLGIPQARWL